MRSLAPAGICLAAAVLSACGGGGSSGGSHEPRTAAATVDKPAPLTDSAKPPKVEIPPGPPPTHLIVKDLKLGSGARIPPQGEVGIRTNYVSLSYQTGKPLEVRWKPRGGFIVGFGPGIVVKGWEKGLVGMKVGGRRELRVPSRMAYGQGDVFYVIDLLGIE